MGLRELVGEGRVEHFSAGGLPDEVTLGEVRRVPELLPAIMRSVDRDRRLPSGISATGKWPLTRSFPDSLAAASRRYWRMCP